MRGRLLGLFVPVALAGAVLAGPGIASAGAGARRPAQPRPIVVQTTRSGFDWGDAAVGAAAAVGVVLAVIGVLVIKGDRNAS